MDCRTALLTLLDCVDYTEGNCRVNEMVGAVLPKEVIYQAREAIRELEQNATLSLSDVPQRIVKIEYLPRPKELASHRIPVIYVEDKYEDSPAQN